MRFSEVHIYANVVNDNTVPYPSAAIDSADHFVQWIERGLEVEADESGIVSDWHFPHPRQARKPRKARFHLGTLPPTLRFRWPYNWVRQLAEVRQQFLTHAVHPRPLPDLLPAHLHFRTLPLLA